MVKSGSSSRTDRTRAAILSSGVELLSEHGVRGITVEGISRRTGIAKTTIYRHWQTREHLVIAVIDEVKFELPTPTTGDCRQDIAIVLESLWALALEPSHRLAIASTIETLVRDSVLEAVHAKLLLESGKPVFDVLARGVQVGELDADLDLEFSFRMLTGPVMAGAVILGAPVDQVFVGHLVERVLGTRGHG